MSSKVLIVGSGVIGLRTALELLRRGIRVSLVSPKHPLHSSTCSMGAGGLWMPFHCDDSRTDRWSFDTLSELSRLSLNSATGGSGSGALVEVLPAVSFKRNDKSQIPEWATDERSKSLAFQHLSIDELYKEGKSQCFRLPGKDVMVEAGYSHAWFFQTPIIDAPKMLMVSHNSNAFIVEIGTAILNNNLISTHGIYNYFCEAHVGRNQIQPSS